MIRAAEPSSAAKGTILSLEAVDFSIGGMPILNDINLSVSRGEFLSIVGSSGCGKTTILRLIAGLLRPTRGSVKYNGAEMTSTRRDMALVFQDYNNALLPWRNAAGNISLALEGVERDALVRKARIAELLEMVGLAAHHASYPRELSGGMQQRLQIARCLAQDPTVLLMDEPFGALDAITRKTLQNELLRIVARTGATVIFVTHDLEEAIYLGDRVVAMRPLPGRIAEAYEVNLPRPRSHLETPDRPEFRELRHQLSAFFDDASHK